MANGSTRNVTQLRNTNIYNAIGNTSPPLAPPQLLLVGFAWSLPSPLHPHLAAPMGPFIAISALPHSLAVGQ